MSTEKTSIAYSQSFWNSTASMKVHINELALSEQIGNDNGIKIHVSDMHVFNSWDVIKRILCSHDYLRTSLPVLIYLCNVLGILYNTKHVAICVHLLACFVIELIAWYICHRPDALSKWLVGKHNTYGLPAYGVGFFENYRQTNINLTNFDINGFDALKNRPFRNLVHV